MLKTANPGQPDIESTPRSWGQAFDPVSEEKPRVGFQRGACTAKLRLTDVRLFSFLEHGRG